MPAAVASATHLPTLADQRAPLASMSRKRNKLPVLTAQHWAFTAPLEAQWTLTRSHAQSESSEPPVTLNHQMIVLEHAQSEHFPTRLVARLSPSASSASEGDGRTRLGFRRSINVISAHQENGVTRLGLTLPRSAKYAPAVSTRTQTRVMLRHLFSWHAEFVPKASSQPRMARASARRVRRGPRCGSWGQPKIMITSPKTAKSVQPILTTRRLVWGQIVTPVRMFRRRKQLSPGG